MLGPKCGYGESMSLEIQGTSDTNKQETEVITLVPSLSYTVY